MSDIISFIKVIIAPNPALRIHAKPVKKITPVILSTVKDMIKLTKSFRDPEGVGLASTQVGLDGQFFVALLQKEPQAKTQGVKSQHVVSPSAPLRVDEVEPKTPSIKNREVEKFITVFNPKITWKSKKVKKYFEGCLSIPNYWGEIQRHSAIKVTYMDETGKSINVSLKGVIAWIFQHEMDHLNGIIFPDRVLEQKGKFYKYTGKDKTGTDIFEEVTI